MAEFDEAIRKDVSAETLQWHLEYLCTLARDSGTPPERQAADYIMEQLRRYGVDARLHEFDAYLSYPLDSTLEVVAPERITLPSRPRAFSASTPDDGIEGEVVFIGEVGPEDKGKMIFAKAGQAEEYRGRDVSGKIVLSTGGGPDGVALAQEHGALALIHMWPSGESNIHEMIVTPVWGTPTPESAGRIPRIPTVSITRGDGERLRAMLDRGSVRLRLRAKTWIGWKRVPLPVGHIPGRHGKEFLLVGAHIDSWYYGATDNATGDACLLELARVLARHQNRLRAGVRFAWWPGHSTGRYAGSTWYVDTQFPELRTHALGYLNIDSPGVRGSKIFDCRYNMGEVEKFMVGVVREVTGEAPNIRRPFKAGDQSFWGVGLPSLGAFRMLPVDHPDRAVVGGCGGGWWWHSPEDTLDKADAGVLADDVRLYATIITRLCTAQDLPFEFATVAEDFRRVLGELQEAADGAVDLGRVIAQADALRAAAIRLEETRARLDRARVNRPLMRLSRVLNPVLYTIAGDFDQDPAVQLPLLPGLQRIRELPFTSGDAREFLLARLIRERNRTLDALARATEMIEDVLAGA